MSNEEKPEMTAEEAKVDKTMFRIACVFAVLLVLYLGRCEWIAQDREAEAKRIAAQPHRLYEFQWKSDGKKRVLQEFDIHRNREICMVIAANAEMKMEPANKLINNRFLKIRYGCKHFKK